MSEMKCDYRCYFLGKDGKIKDFVEFACADDAAAIAEAQQHFVRQRGYGGFELWQGARKVALPPAGEK